MEGGGGRERERAEGGKGGGGGAGGERRERGGKEWKEEREKIMCRYVCVYAYKHTALYSVEVYSFLSSAADGD